MALGKEIPAAYSKAVVATYHKITSIIDNPTISRVTLNIGGYTSKAAAEAGEGPVCGGVVSVEGADAGYRKGLTWAEMYALAKADKRFDGAEDC